MWPVLTKVQYECLPTIFSTRRIWIHVGISFVLNWIIAPFIMLGLAWATLSEASLERERKGVILVGVGTTGPLLELKYSQVSTSVGIYLGIPLAAGLVTRFTLKRFLKPAAFASFLKWFGPLALVGLLYTIVVLFANQGKRIVDNIGSVFRIFVPLVLYFVIVWSTTFFSLYHLSRKRFSDSLGGYDKAVVQSFTAGSNNFELAIAVAIANFGTESPEALAATIGPLVEVPVLLALTYFALWLKPRLHWKGEITLE
ncbi:hypothetical protein FRC05_001137 [Tulasnella sp. 425]|nr:hypothetical protein FRC05_001137 [Tulasnella sp. 425]